METNPNIPIVSVLMAVCNASSFLEKALQSMLDQTLTSWQLICVDDASTDSSLSILQQFAAKDSRITVIHKDFNEGQAIARNEALLHAKGQYVTMLDADDWLSTDCLELAVKAFTPETDCVVLRLMEHYDADGREQLYPSYYADGHALLSGYEAFVASLDWRLHGIYVVRRDIHERYPYDTSCRLYSDDNTTRLHYLHSREVRFCQGTYYYRKHPSSCTNAITADRFLYMEANLSMKRTLESEGLAEEVISMYEKHRWLNYIDQLWLYSLYHGQLNKQEQREVKQRFHRIYDTFRGRPVPVKFGYTRMRSYRLFLFQESLYFALRKLFRRT